MYPASVEYLNRQRIIPNWGGGLWEQWYIYLFPFFSFCECVCVCFWVWFSLYSFAFTICPRVLFVRFFLHKKYFFLTIIFYFNNFMLFYFILSSSFFFPPFYSELCEWKALGVPARSQCCASEVGGPSSGHWSTRDLPAPHNIKWQKSPRDLHLKTKTQLHSRTSKLQCRTPSDKQLARQKHSPIH